MVLNRYILLILTTCAIGLFETSLWAATVVKVTSSKKFAAISKDPEHAWVVGDAVCFYANNKQLGCGAVNKVVGSGAIVAISTGGSALAAGAEVRRLERKGASVHSVVDETVEADKAKKWEASAGVLAGFTAYFPMISIGRAVSRHFVITFTGNILNVSTAAGGSLVAIGPYIMAHYYPKQIYRGWWFQGGGGLELFTIKATANSVGESAKSFGALGTVGYKSTWEGMNLGIAAGAIYLKQPATTTVSVDYSQIQPLALLSIGISF